jgi:L,D-transpeptidase catalytic domain
MRLRCLAAVCAAAVLMFLGQAARADLLIKVDKSVQQMTVIADGKELYTWPVSTGRSGFNTPSGAYTPFRMDRHHFSREWDDAPMPYSIFFTQKGHAIHGTYEQRYLGHAVSHGCVRLSVAHAAILWDLVKENGKDHTTVVLTGEIPAGSEPKVARVERNDDAPRVHKARHWREADEDQRESYYADEPRYYGRYRSYRYRDEYRGPPFPFFFFPPR